MLRRILLALAAAALLAACGQGEKPAAAAFNDADVTFATKMIPHHQQAIEMADLARARAARAQLKTMADNITSSQGQEITRMQGWLRAWRKPVPAAEATEHSTMDHAGSGMMTKAQMDQLMALHGNKFDAAFLELMTQHHQGAIAMAKEEQAKGQAAEAKRLAGQIISAQQQEITQMTTWRQQWGATMPNS
jgi:uncharacterized protein (DUF305 family)